MSLLDLPDDWTEETLEWEPIFYRFTLADLVRDQLCRDCGTKVTWVNRVDEHDDLIHDRERRRAKYRAKHQTRVMEVASHV